MHTLRRSGHRRATNGAGRRLGNGAGDHGHGQREEADQRRRTHAASRRAPPRHAWAHRHTRRLRHQSVRRLHRPRRRPRDEVLHDPRGPDRRRRGRDRRRPRQERRAPSGPTRIRERTRAPVRLLHPGLDDHRRRLPRPQRLAERCRDTPRDRGQPLPLHRLPQHRERHQVRRRNDDDERAVEGRRGGEAMTTASTTTYIRTRLQRKEDPRLITGSGLFTDDVTLPGMVYVSLVRSPHAHARIRRIDTSAATKKPGVVAVLTGKDLEATGVLPVFISVPKQSTSKHMPIATDKVRYAGDAVAAVVAETRDAAKRAADAVTVDYEPLPVLADATQAVEPGAPIVNEELGTNLVFTYPVKGGGIDKAFRDAEVKVALHLVNQRLIANPMEPRSAAAKFEAGERTPRLT